jgi:hypothetical protein
MEQKVQRALMKLRLPHDRGVRLGKKENRFGSLGTARFAGSIENRPVQSVFTVSIAGMVF